MAPEVVEWREHRRSHLGTKARISATSCGTARRSFSRDSQGRRDTAPFLKRQETLDGGDVLVVEGQLADRLEVRFTVRRVLR